MVVATGCDITYQGVGSMKHPPEPFLISSPATRRCETKPVKPIRYIDLGLRGEEEVEWRDGGVNLCIPYATTALGVGHTFPTFNGKLVYVTETYLKPDSLLAGTSPAQCEIRLRTDWCECECDCFRSVQPLRWAGHVARMDESRNAYRVLVGRPEGKRPLGRPRRRWEDNIKMDLRNVGYDDRDWINLAQDRDQWRAYVRAAMNLRDPLKANEAAKSKSRSRLTDDNLKYQLTIAMTDIIPE
ncbi:hypothetical protein ANN_26011 [Periplaneta americana]|uniref:Uncharacterized protein n=1 Tax=Periplaneta americana TaxID=6978 RepID=A0ABQ8S5I9_PERAM|nr:hypothetical protein ANN_26011 [Periplaneta americana]